MYYVLYFSLEDFNSVTMNDDINSCLDKINVRLKLNKLTVNVSKTKFMIFNKRRDVRRTRSKFIAKQHKY